MTHISTGGRRGIAAASILGLLALATACGTQTDTATDFSNAGSDIGFVTHPGQAHKVQKGQSGKALDADARRWAQGQLPSVHPEPAAKRVPDARP